MLLDYKLYCGLSRLGLQCTLRFFFIEKPNILRVNKNSLGKRYQCVHCLNLMWYLFDFVLNYQQLVIPLVCIIFHSNYFIEMNLLLLTWTYANSSKNITKYFNRMRIFVNWDIFSYAYFHNFIYLYVNDH